MRETGRVTGVSCVGTFAHECGIDSCQIMALKEKTKPDKMNLEGCFVTVDVALLSVPPCYDSNGFGSAPIFSLVWLSVEVRFHEGITCMETAASFYVEC